jgi:hypothetical protein
MGTSPGPFQIRLARPPFPSDRLLRGKCVDNKNQVSTAHGYAVHLASSGCNRRDVRPATIAFDGHTAHLADLVDALAWQNHITTFLLLPHSVICLSRSIGELPVR